MKEYVVKTTHFGHLRERHLGALLRLRHAKGQHTTAEARALAAYAENCGHVVEIGVAEGVSAAQFRSVMPRTGTLWLVDPYISRYRVSAAQVVAKRTVGRVGGAAVVWVRKFSH